MDTILVPPFQGRICESGNHTYFPLHPPYFALDKQIGSSENPTIMPRFACVIAPGFPHYITQRGNRRQFGMANSEFSKAKEECLTIQKKIERQVMYIKIAFVLFCLFPLSIAFPATSLQNAIMELNEIQSKYKIVNSGNCDDLLHPFTHLSLMPGYKLTFVYTGKYPYKPTLYANNVVRPDMAKQNYINYITNDSTTKGYIELLSFHILGDQFHLTAWAKKYQTYIVDTSESLLSIINGLKGNRSNEEKIEIMSAFGGMDLSPIVHVGAVDVSIELVTYAQRKGFQKIRYSMKKEAPYDIRIQSKMLIINPDFFGTKDGSFYSHSEYD